MHIKYVLVDVEAGPNPLMPGASGRSPYSGLMTEFGAVELESKTGFHGKLIDASPNPDNPAVPLITEESTIFDHKQVCAEFVAWLDSLGGSRVVFVSDNPAFDFMWMAYFFDECGVYNPFGFSGRRISDFWAGLQQDWTQTQGWKRFRKTKHDHNPLNDSMGNAEALEEICRIHRVKLR